MKRIMTLSLTAALALGLFSGCGGPAEEESASADAPVAITGTAEHLTILLPPGADAATVAEHAEPFCAALDQEMRSRGWDVAEITVETAATGALAGKALDDGTADVAILPASQYFTYSEAATLLMTATRKGVSVSSETAADWNGSVDAPSYTDADVPYGRTLICTTQSETGRALAQAAKNGTLTWEELSQAKWIYPEAASSSDFIYPDLWLTDEFGKTMEDLPNVRGVDGYGVLFAEAGRQEADVIVLSADMRIDYSAAWQLSEDDIDHTGKLGMGHEDSIFNDLQVIGVTEPIYGDVMALRTEESPYSDANFQSALIASMDALKNNEHARALWETCGYTGFTASGDGHYDNIRELTVFGAGD